MFFVCQRLEAKTLTFTQMLSELEKSARAVVSHACTYCHTCQCSVIRRFGSCTPTSEMTVMEFFMSWRLAESNPHVGLFNTTNIVVLGPTLWLQ